MSYCKRGLFEDKICGDCWKKTERVKKIFLKIGVGILGFCLGWGIGFILEIGMDRSEKVECLKWQKYAEEYPGFYLTDWQKAQCKNQKVEILLNEGK